MTETNRQDDNILDPADAGDARYIQTQVNRYEQTLAERVNRLRKLADEIEREGRPFAGAPASDGQPDYLFAAQRVIHALHWGLANADIGGVLASAADAHNAVRLRTK